MAMTPRNDSSRWKVTMWQRLPRPNQLSKSRLKIRSSDERKNQDTQLIHQFFELIFHSHDAPSIGYFERILSREMCCEKINWGGGIEQGELVAYLRGVRGVFAGCAQGELRWRVWPRGVAAELVVQPQGEDVAGDGWEVILTLRIHALGFEGVVLTRCCELRSGNSETGVGWERESLDVCGEFGDDSSLFLLELGDFEGEFHAEVEVRVEFGKVVADSDEVA